MSTYVETYSHECEGFKILVKYQSWRTAVLNQGKENKPEFISYAEKHNESDEVFLLLKGKAYLVIGGDGGKPESFEVMPMEPLKTYNVKAKVWHACLMSPDASIYIVENADTGRENGEHYSLSAEEKRKILSGVSFS